MPYPPGEGWRAKKRRYTDDKIEKALRVQWIEVSADRPHGRGYWIHLAMPGHHKTFCGRVYYYTDGAGRKRKRPDWHVIRPVNYLLYPVSCKRCVRGAWLRWRQPGVDAVTQTAAAPVQMQ